MLWIFTFILLLYSTMMEKIFFLVMQHVKKKALKLNFL